VADFRTELLNKLFENGLIFDYHANARCVLPVESFPYFYPFMFRAWEQLKEEQQELLPLMEALLEQLREEGPMCSRELGNEGPRLEDIGWTSSGRPGKASRRALELLWRGGRIVVSHREGGEKYYQPTEVQLPREIVESSGFGTGKPAYCLEAAERELLLMYLGAYGLAETGDHRFGWRKRRAAARAALVEVELKRGSLVKVEMEGVDSPYYALAEEVPVLEEAETWSPVPHIFILPPLDNVLWSRTRLEEIWDFHYRWEVYTPKDQRRYGPYTMPVVEGDALIGRVDLRCDRTEVALEVNILELEQGLDWTNRRRKGLAAKLQQLADYLGAANIKVPDGSRVPPGIRSLL
jgi:hypothetical protein